MNKPFLILWGIVFFGCLCFFLWMMYSVISGKGQSKLMARQIKRSKQILEDNKEGIKDLQKLGAELNIDVRKEILEDKMDSLQDISSVSADIESVGLEKKAAAIKKGLGSDTVYCKHCGALIDSDSRYCKVCGKEQ